MKTEKDIERVLEFFVKLAGRKQAEVVIEETLRFGLKVFKQVAPVGRASLERAKALRFMVKNPWALSLLYLIARSQAGRFEGLRARFTKIDRGFLKTVAGLVQEKALGRSRERTSKHPREQTLGEKLDEFLAKLR